MTKTHFYDVVFPNNSVHRSEDSFITMAQRLGYDGLVCVYATEQLLRDAERAAEKKEETERKEKSEKGIKSISVVRAMLGRPDERKKKKAVTFMKSSALDRKVLETASADVLYGMEQELDDKSVKGARMNHILCAIAKEKKVMFGFSFASLLETSKQYRAKRMNQIMQHLGLARKYGIRIIIGSWATHPYGMRAPRDLVELFSSLGLPVNEASNALGNAALLVAKEQ